MKEEIDYINISDLEDYMKGTINTLKALAEEWQQTRTKYTGAELIRYLGSTTVKILDDFGDINTCSEDGCYELAYKEWDFCKRHGTGK